ncbi:cbb3-type cytochrome oxidase subunit 3 [Castellaniella sp.]|uniref:cbb3-type cytochrome oxidase subunit 3 n=1 Tax=Castellaniella sp. TaxID=1955812 RepID=UPI00355E4AA6
MSPVLIGIGTVLAMATFIGIVWWAWSGRRAKDNEQAANLPFDLPDEYPGDKNTGEEK